MPKMRPKIEPTVLRYASMADLPPLDELAHLAETNDWVIFEVPTQETVDTDGKRRDPTIAERDQIARELMPRLPFHTVQEGWNILDKAFLYPVRTGPLTTGQVVEAWGRFSTRRNMTQKAIEQNVDLCLLAVADYEETINALMPRLAKQLGVDISEFSDTTRGRESWWHEEQVGILRVTSDDPAGAEEWRWFFHGHDCAFGGMQSGVSVEACLGFGSVCGNNFAALDTGFFLEFLKTNERFTLVADTLRDDYRDTNRLLDYMEQQGLLKRVQLEWSGGLLLSGAGRERVRKLQAAEARNNV